MGVPKFYRWLSERYPLINNLLSDRSILPEIDNLYLDMNGIIHACTHPNDQDVSSTLTLREMMLAIFRYIDRMVTEIVKPKKILFMAIDGCAPRAKMNQQRSRRFRAAQERLELTAKAKERGDVIDEENMFDSNCITPGTEFMEQVGKHLRWFIRKKMKEDPLWRDLEVTFSGHDVPGEGEHKIMQFIRELRARDDYQPNVRHCMYGQDADLIMLGLATHEPHFTLLREVVNFNSGFAGKGASAKSVVLRQSKEAQFQLLNLAVLREYIEVDLALGCGYAVDKERLIDDFILLTFLVGNDFLPHLPTLDIGEHAFDLVFSSYKELLEEAEGYLVKEGNLGDLERLERLFQKIGKQEADILANREYEEKKFQAKRRKFKDNNVKSEEEAEEEEEEAQRAYQAAVQEALGNKSDAPSATPSAETKRDDEGGLITKDYRGRYYFEKFKVVCGTNSGTEYLSTLMEKYLEGLMWCLAYYIKGCISWTWFYPYHYGPMLIDMHGLAGMFSRIKFDLGKPFLPFQQLLGCLPPPSKKLLPRSYQWVMTSESSPMIDSYPADFSVDMDGKKNPWEAVVLLPFIDEKVLMSAERDHCREDQLTSDEKARNRFGKVLQHRYDPSVTDTYFSCNPEIGLPDVPKCQTSVVELEPDYNPGPSFKPELVPGTAACLAGFPSLGALRIANVTTEPIKLNVFGSESKYRTVAIDLDSPEYDPDSIDIKGLLGRVVFVNYPQLHEARVVAVSNEREEFRLSPCKDPAFPNTFDTVHTKFNLVDEQRWKKEAAEEEGRYIKGRGLPGAGGLVIGQVKIRLRVQALQGMKRDTVSGANKKVYGTEEADVPIQMALWSPPVVDQRFLETDDVPVSTLYPHGCEVIGVSGRFKGCLGVVVGPHSEEESRLRAGQAMDARERGLPRSVDIEFTMPPPEPPFGYMIEASIKEDYFSARDVSRSLTISPSLLGRVVGSLIVDRVDVGLNLKRSGQYFLLGYVREVVPAGSSAAAWGSVRDSVRVIGAVDDAAAEVGRDPSAPVTGSNWEYSAKAVALLLEYKTEFPNLFSNLERLGHEKKYSSEQAFGVNKTQAPALLAKLEEWLGRQYTAKAARTPLSTTSLSKEAMKAVERAADVRTSHLAAQAPERLVVKKVPLEAIFRGDSVSQFDAPLLFNANTVPRLGDRARNLNSLGVPFGLKGTVITIHNATGYVEVIFDEEFTGGRALGGSCSQFRGRLCPWHGLLRVSSDDQAASVGSTGRGAASATKPQAQFNPGDAVKKAAPKPQQQAQAVAARDGHVMGMHPKPVPHKERAAATAAPGSVQQLSLLTRGLEVARADVPVTFATDAPEEVRYRPPPKPQAQPRAQPPAAPAAEPATQGTSILSLLKQQLKISPDEPPPAPAAASASSSTASASMGGFRIHRAPPAAGASVDSSAQAVTPAPPAPPAVPLEPVVLSDGSGRAALAQAAGLVGSALPPMPAGPVEAPLSGVIQVPTVPGGLLGIVKAKAGAAPQVKGFFSGTEGKGQRPPSPSKTRAASPSKKAPTAKAEAAAPRPAEGEEKESGSKPAAVSVKERLANAKAMMLKRRQDKGIEATEPTAAPTETRSEAEAEAAAAPVSLADLEGSTSASAAQGAAAAPSGPDKAGEKKLVPLNLLLLKKSAGK